ncbi:MAG: signal peptidase I [Ignavibacteriales bacterium]|nr:signal peptidase I [Ignavibacteriales bacterium]
MDWKKALRKFFGIRTEEELKQKEVKTPKQKAKHFVETLLFAFIGAMLIKTFLLESSRIPTGSMETTILVGDFVLVNKVIYGSSSPRTIPFTDVRLPYFTTPSFREPRHKDVIVFEYPGDREQYKPDVVLSYVKRCVGLPGDTIQVKDKVLFVNGKEFWRPPHIQYLTPQPMPVGYVNPRIFPKDAPWNEDNYGPLYIPKKGDVIKLTIDNVDQWKTIIDRELEKEDAVTVEGNQIQIDGKPVTSYTLQDNYYFMMGDNRDNSLDSRFWGFVPRSKIVGEALMLYWSWDPSIPWSQFFDLLGSVRLNRIAKLIH